MAFGISSLSAQEVNFKKWPATLTNPFIKDIQRSKNYIWIASANGLQRVKSKKDKGKTFNIASGFPDTFITAVAIEPNEKIVWVGTPKGLARLNVVRNSSVVFNKRNRELSDDRVQCLLLDGKTLYVGTKFGVDIFDIEKNKWKPYTAIEGLAGNDIQALANDGDQVWAAGADGISAYDKNEDFWISYDATNGLNSPLAIALSVDAGAIWVGTAGGGLNRFDKDSLRFEPLTENEGLIDDNVQTIIDDGLYLWVGTFNGVSRLEKTSLLFENYQAKNGISEPSIVASLIDGNNLFIGSDGGGIYTLNKGIPQVSFSTKTRYRKKKSISIYGSVLSRSGISDVKLSYKSAASLKNEWFKKGVSIENEKNGRDLLLGTIDVSSLKDGKYLIAIEVEDEAGKKNRSTGVMIVDNTAPDVRVFFRAPRPGEKKVTVNGRYIDSNLSKLSVQIGGRKLSSKLISLNRQQKRFRFPYVVGSGAKIIIVAEDIGKNSVSKTLSYVVDRNPPKIKVKPVDGSKLNTNVVQIKGTVEDENIDQVIVNPGQILAELSPDGENLYTFTAKAPIKKEGKFTFQITAFDKSGRTANAKLVVKFFSEETIIEINEDKIPKFTLKDTLEVSGNILGPELKEFYILPGKINIKLKKDKSFKTAIKLKPGKNKIIVVGIHKTGEKVSADYEIESSKKNPRAELDNNSRSFSRRKVTIRGKFDKGIRQIYINGKKAEMDFKESTYQREIVLREGRNSVNIKTVDQLGKVRKKKENVYYDVDAPELFVRSLPSQTGIQDLKFKGRVSDVSDFKITVFPSARVQLLSAEKGEFEGRVLLHQGENRIFFVSTDAAGNTAKKEYLVSYDPKFPKREVGGSADYQEELYVLKTELEKLKKLLKNKRFSNIPTGFVRSKLPKRAGLYLLPMAGKIKSYDTAAQLYLGDRYFGEIVASYNGRNPQRLKRVLIPSPELFRLLNKSGIGSTFNKVVEKSGNAFMRRRKFSTIERSVMKYLIRSKKLRRVKENKSYTEFALRNGTAIVLSKNGRGIEKNKLRGYSEVLITKIKKNGLVFSRL